MHGIKQQCFHSTGKVSNSTNRVSNKNKIEAIIFRGRRVPVLFKSINMENIGNKVGACLVLLFLQQIMFSVFDLQNEQLREMGFPTLRR